MWWSTALLTKSSTRFAQPGPAQDRDLAHRLLGEREGVVEERHVGEVIGVDVADPDRVQILQVDVALERTEDSAADVDQDVGAAGLEQDNRSTAPRPGDTARCPAWSSGSDLRPSCPCQPRPSPPKCPRCDRCVSSADRSARGDYVPGALDGVPILAPPVHSPAPMHFRSTGRSHRQGRSAIDRTMFVVWRAIRCSDTIRL